MSKITHWVISLFLAFIGYLSPASNVFQLMLGAIFIDMIIGMIASRVVKGERLIPEKIYMTIIKAVFATLLIIMLYAVDKEMGFAGIVTHRAIAWLITISEIWSIARHMGEITNHRIFKVIKGFSLKNIKDKTGVDLTKEN